MGLGRLSGAAHSSLGQQQPLRSAPLRSLSVGMQQGQAPGGRAAAAMGADAGMQVQQHDLHMQRPPPADAAPDAAPYQAALPA